MKLLGLLASPIVRQMFASLTGALTSISSGFWLGWPSISIPKIQANATDLTMDKEEISWMVSLMDIGILVSPVPTIYLADHLGRKSALVCMGVLLLLTSILISVAYNVWFLYTARLLSGIAKGMCFTVIPLYSAEVASVSIRGALSVIFSQAVWIGVLIVTVIGPFLSFTFVAVVGGVIPFVLLCLIPFIPETPYFLLMRGQNKHALRSLMWLRSSSFTSEIEKELKDMQDLVKNDVKSNGKLRDLLTNPSDRRALSITLILILLQKFTGINAIIAYTSTTLPKGMQYLGPSETMVVFTCACVLSWTLAMLLIDRWGRKLLLMLSVACCVLVNIAMALFYFLYQVSRLDMSALTWVPHTLIILTGLVHFGIGTVPFTLQGELFRMTLRTHAIALGTIVLSLSSFLVDKLYVTVDINIGVYANYIFFALCGVICYIYTHFFVFETRLKSFSEIQKILQRAE